MTDVKSMNIGELKAMFLEMNEKPFRATQLFRWLHINKAGSFSEMTDFSQNLRERLENTCEITSLGIERVEASKTDGTRKYLFSLKDNNLIESVFMKYHHGNTVCVSSQVGCRMGCRFCASTVDGLIRSLTPSEILEQVYKIEQDTKETVSGVVIMGSGEPMDNYDNVVKFIKLITDENGKNLSRRAVTVSTCGIPGKIRELADENLGVTLALSLHASNDETRKTLMPIAKRYTIKEVLGACDYFFEKTGRRVTYEYSVVKDVNANVKEAEKLGKLLKGKNAHVNLIPVNPIKESNLLRPEFSEIITFQKVLDKYGVNATIRRELGSDIDASCGQLRRRFMNSN